ncbi:hypothetical protein SCUP234_03299 [Seiridium cupressi]
MVLSPTARSISARHLIEHIALRHLRRQVVDIKLRDVLMPDYPIGSKRILFDSKFYPALSHENVRLVTNPIRRITSDIVQIANGEQIQADIVICATGVKASEFLVPISVRGPNNRSLNDDWPEGAEAFMGLAVGGHPKMFMHKIAELNRNVIWDQSCTLVETLWQENQGLVEKFLNNEFIKLQAQGEQDVTLPAYQYYSTQDYYYLVNYVQYKALRMTTYSEVYPTQLLSIMTEETEALSGDIDYAWSYRNTTLAGDLAVPLDAIDSGTLDVAQIAYSDWLQKNLDLGWFTMHVQSIPCIYGWVKLAEYWAEKNTTRKGEIAAGHDHSLLRRFELTQVSRVDTLFYNTWIEPNNDLSYADDLISFLEANKDAYYSANANQTWTAVFREALQFEIDFFDSALGKSPADL